MTLSEYIKRRNGVALGAEKSLHNMLDRSLGAGNFATFWKYWNPIWSYYLGKYIFKPLKTILPPTFSLILTFIVCGLIHDIAIMLVRWKFALLITPWFFIMGIWLVISEALKLDYSNYSWVSRACINLFIIALSFMLARPFSI